MAVVWPAALPQSFEIDGYSIQPSDNVIREQMEVGPAKTRRRASVSTVQVSAELKLSETQRGYFDGFYKNVLFHGTNAFRMRDPGGTLRDYFIMSVSYAQGQDIWPFWRAQLQMFYVD
jgi:hypothetical protein